MSGRARIDKVGFGAGAGWLTAGGELLSRGGVALVRIAAVLLLLSLLQWIPVIGLLLLVVITPALTAGMLNVFGAIERGDAPTVDLFLAGLTDARARGPLLVLGGVLMLGMFAAVAAFTAWLAPQMDLQALSELLAEPQALEGNPDQLFALFQGVNLVGGLALSLTIAGLVLSALFFAVPLVFFWQWPLLAAALWSLRAVLINWLAFAGYVLVLIVILILIGFLLATVSGLLTLALGPAGALFVQVLTVVVSMFVQLLLAAAQWKAFLTVFPAGGDASVDER